MSGQADERFIKAVAVVSVISALVLLVATSPAIRVAFGLPFALVLPGYAIVAALFPQRALGIPERLVLSIGLSLAVAALGGLLLNWTSWGLRVESWAVLLCATTCLASVIAIKRRRRSPAVTSMPVGIGLSGRQALLLGLAAVVVVAAIGLARTPAPQQSVQGYTLLWMLPSDDGNPNTVRLGVECMELAPTPYRLEVKVDGRIAQEWSSILLKPGAKWENRIVLPAGFGSGTVEAALYRLDDLQSVYRQVILRLGESQ